MNFLGSIWLYIVLSLVFFELIIPLFLAFIFLTGFIVLARLFVPKKRKKRPKLLFGKDFWIVNLINSRSFISAHVARTTAFIVILSIHFSFFFFSLFLVSFILGYVRIKQGFHDFVDVLVGFLVGAYFGVLSYYLFLLF
ncbi:MAG: phosphatase PAP2 family protein [Candidatus Woesearchaeota archaeon]